MRKTLLGLLALSGMVLAAPSREKRQTGCISSFLNVPNVCRNNPNGQTFFSHPTDSTKFLQCDIYNRMYIIQCPQGEVFQLRTTSCQPSQQTNTPLPVTTQPPRTIQPPATTQPPAITSVPVVGKNPCNAQSIAWGQLYFPHTSDKTKYYQCDQQGHASVVSCPVLMEWDQTILSCAYPVTVSSGQPKPTQQIQVDQANNPCTPQAIKEDRLFFPHLDNTKYIQCDLSRNAYINSCPAKLVWNAFLETCYSPLSGVPGGRK
ncbi:hypothetical protein ACOMHN_048443 [Nucella lapillus]